MAGNIHLQSGTYFSAVFFCMGAMGKKVLFPAIHISVNMVIRFRYVLMQFFMFPGQHLLALPMV
jgi:hypothetical protein